MMEHPNGLSEKNIKTALASCVVRAYYFWLLDRDSETQIFLDGIPQYQTMLSELDGEKYE